MNTSIDDAVDDDGNDDDGTDDDGDGTGDDAISCLFSVTHCIVYRRLDALGNHLSGC